MQSVHRLIRFAGACFVLGAVSVFGAPVFRGPPIRVVEIPRSALHESLMQPYQHDQLHLALQGNRVLGQGLRPNGQAYQFEMKVEPGSSLFNQQLRGLVEQSGAHTRITLDRSFLEAPDQRGVDLQGFSNIVAWRAPVVGIESLKTVSNESILMSKIVGCCLYGIPPLRAAEYRRVLGNARIDPQDIRVASLFVDNATEAQIAGSPAFRKARLSGDAGWIRDERDIGALLWQASGKTLVLLAHTEGFDYVIRGPAGEVRARIPISEVRRLAKAYRVNLIDLGCSNATRVDNVSQFGFGLLTEYRSTAAVDAVNRAIQDSRTALDFLGAIASDDIKVVIDAQFSWPNSTSHEVSLYRRWLSDSWYRIARLSLHFQSNP